MSKYIKLEDVFALVKKANMTNVNMIELYSKVHSLPSIDPQEMIREMIEESKTQWAWFEYDSWTIEALLNKLP